MHTFLKRAALNYEIGSWLPAREGSTWVGLLVVNKLDDAIRLVNVLNGGPGELSMLSAVLKNLKEVEEVY